LVQNVRRGHREVEVEVEVEAGGPPAENRVRWLTLMSLVARGIVV